MQIKRIIIPTYILEKLEWKHHVVEEEVHELLRGRHKLYFVEKGDIEKEKMFISL
jgi:hypothetical protein